MFIRDNAYLVETMDSAERNKSGLTVTLNSQKKGRIRVCGFAVVGDEGDIILYSKATEVVIQGTRFDLVEEKDMLAVYNEEEVWKKKEEVVPVDEEVDNDPEVKLE